MNETVILTDAQRDRAVGALLGTAVGDALGAGYKLEQPRAESVHLHEEEAGPGEWTGDTAMAVAIAEIATTGADLLAERSLDYIAERWYWWARTAQDVDKQTSRVLSMAAQRGISARTARTAAAEYYRRTGRDAGAGSLTRAAPVALAYLHDEAALVQAARTITELTHAGPETGDACVLWCTAVRHAVLTGDLDSRIGLGHIASERRNVWAVRLVAAERANPSGFAVNNSQVGAALQGGWSAIATTPVPRENPAAEVFACEHLRLALEAALRDGGDTHAVAANAGGLLGAVHGGSAVPWQWRRALKGWPGLNARALVRLATLIIDRGEPEGVDRGYAAWRGYPRPVPHPCDQKVWIGAAPSLRKLPSGVGSVVSLCRVADHDIPSRTEHLEVRLDRTGADSNLDFVLLDTVRAVEGLRAEGRTVFVHGTRVNNRAAAVAALYGARRQGIDVEQALAQVCAVFPEADPTPDLRAALQRLAPTTRSVR